MFNERDALKLRLEQLAEQEERFLKLFREERELIFTKLRELDTSEKPVKTEVVEKTPVDPELTEVVKPAPTPAKKAAQPKKSSTPSPQGNKRGRKPTVTPEKEAAIEILKMHPEGMKGVDLQRAVEEATGSPIANMTTFMKSVENLDPNVQKPSRGTYIYANTDTPFGEF
ncbi:transcriptional regulator Rok [Bacillus carboniphilus]|uniref:Transcriptional regulator Rok n=1 Tax=Bacillus carboniphilus TaxID=86663 RepID=A0ABN0VXA2_9BACI